MTTSTVTAQIIALATKHVDNGAAMMSSARLCLDDALRCLADGGESNARACAVRSLSYSVGLFHADHQLAVALRFGDCDSLARRATESCRLTSR